ncbi:LysR substrate-binding domain-containing protein [Burkholderia gladioli]|uniref:LysR substrate-binding domain-containing protein n=1 Tax=Burkholderia gladioli TaxID=28095 RepID=UPI0016413C1C|nr:LysR substrate-binding domain-containing protein [Burkholderia gladioli]
MKSEAQSQRLKLISSLAFLRGFESAARHLSFTNAAREMQMTQSAVSRQVQALEQQLDVLLFERHTRAVTLTPEGEKFRDAVVEAFSILGSAICNLPSMAMDREISISMPAAFAALWFMPNLHSFRHGHSNINVRIHVSDDATASSSSHPSDLMVINLAPGAATHRNAVLFEEHVVPVCSPTLVASGRIAENFTPDILGTQTLLHLRGHKENRRLYEWPAFLRELDTSFARSRRSLHLSQYDQIVAAALNGYGIAIGRRPLIDSLLAEGRLVELRIPHPIKSGDYVLQRKTETYNNPKEELLAAWLLEQSKSWRKGGEVYSPLSDTTL